MVLNFIKSRLAAFRNDESGTVMVETVIVLPMLFWVVAASYEFFEVHRYNSARDKATYTVADMISREMSTVDANYMDNTKTLFDSITNDDGDTQLRVSVILYDADEDKYNVKWSEVRGDGRLTTLTTSAIETANDDFPMMRDGEEVIIVESVSDYPALFNVGLGDDLEIETRVFTSPRFAPQIVWEN